MLDLLLSAAELAKPTGLADPRRFWLGCIGIRNDGATVSSKNGSVQHLFSRSLNPLDMQKVCDYHAEGRVLKKMTRGGELYVARVSRNTHQLVMARPCGFCQARIRSYKIDKVFYSINNDQYGIWYPKDDPDGEEDRIVSAF